MHLYVYHMYWIIPNDCINRGDIMKLGYGHIEYHFCTYGISLRSFFSLPYIFGFYWIRVILDPWYTKLLYWYRDDCVNALKLVMYVLIIAACQYPKPNRTITFLAGAWEPNTTIFSAGKFANYWKYFSKLLNSQGFCVFFNEQELP